MDQKNNKAFINGNIDLLILYKSVSKNLKQILTLPLIFVFIYLIFFNLYSNLFFICIILYNYNKSGSSSISSLLPSNLGIQNDNSLSFSVSNLMMSDKFFKRYCSERIHY